MAGLFDWLGQSGTQNLFGLGSWGGLPAQPAAQSAAAPPGTATGTPAYSPEMIANSRYQLLAQMGMGLMAAGQPMSGAQRSQYLAQLGQLPADYQKSLAQQLEMAQKQQEYQRQQQAQAYLSNMSPDQLQKLGFTPEQATLFKGMGAPADILEKKAFATQDPVNWQTTQTDQGVFAYNPRDPSQTMRIGGAPQKSPDLITLTPPQGSKETAQTFNVNDPADYAKAHDLTTQGWTRASASTTINMPKPATEAQQRIGNLYGNIYQSNRELAQNENALTNKWDSFLQRGGTVGNLLQSSEYQQAIRSQTDFVQQLAYVRSGSNLAQPEAERLANGYFARPGDKPEVIAAKKKARNIALLSLKAAMGEQRPMLEQIEKEIDQQDNPDLGAP
jgi:hypothetical protein